MLGRVRVGAYDDDRPVGDVRRGRPDLLAVDGPGVAVEDRAGREAREVGAGAGLGEELAPHLLAAPQRAQVAPLLLLGAEREDRGRGHAQADADPLRVVVGRAGRVEGLLDDRLHAAREAEAAEALAGSAPTPGPRRSGRAGSPGGPSWPAGARRAARRSAAAGRTHPSVARASRSRSWRGSSCAPRPVRRRTAACGSRRTPRRAGSPVRVRRRRAPGSPCRGSTARSAVSRS